ncbi:hypothetical protein FGO68_gene3708 [Halteria grandinella]|uniref:Uncharacterized protein n=1 Tax=Halteria grandinella TaxID=5974 RepID=A0A8J8P4A2_HALGN|nr:hypothetical protein FGO68_gene3708 [Halteria grandinella]
MVHPKDALIAYTAVVGTRGLHVITCLTVSILEQLIKPCIPYLSFLLLLIPNLHCDLFAKQRLRSLLNEYLDVIGGLFILYINQPLFHEARVRSYYCYQ